MKIVIEVPDDVTDHSPWAYANGIRKILDAGGAALISKDDRQVFPIRTEWVTIHV